MSRTFRGQAELQRQLEGSHPLAVLPGGFIAYARGNDVCVCDPATTDAPRVLEGHTHTVWDLAVLADGRVVCGSDDNTVRVWDLAGGAPRVLEGHMNCVSALAVLPDGRVASASRDNTVRVWDLAGGGPRVLEGDISSTSQP